MRKGEVRRQSIIEASERLFSAKGYLETTVDDILAELQCSKGSFYHYFDSKLSVLTAICEEKVRLWFDAYKKTRVTSTRERLNVLLRCTQPFRPEDPAYLADFDRLMASTSLVILDLKEIDPERHRRLTGKDNANILAMARHVSDLGVPLWIRHVLVPGLTDDEAGLTQMAEFLRSLKTVERVEVLPYHTLGLFKWQKLGIPYPLPDAVPPTPEQVKRAEELLQVQRYPG